VICRYTMVAWLKNDNPNNLLISTLLFFFLLLPQAHAEENLFSVSANYIPNGILLPFAVTIQQGSISDNTMFRAGIDLPLTFLHADVSYITSFSDSAIDSESNTDVRAYAGLGADLNLLIVFIPGLHAHVGFEIKDGDSAFYMEYKPTYFFGTVDNEVFHKVSAGVNFYF